MRILAMTLILFSVNSWAGLQVQHCSTQNLSRSVKLCFEGILFKGKLNVEGEKVDLQFSMEPTPKAFFTLPSTGQTGAVEISGSEALLQFDSEPSIQLKCDQIQPGYCR